jgi:hypothetical protein
MSKPIHVENRPLLVGQLYFSISKPTVCNKLVVEMGDVSWKGGSQKVVKLITTTTQLKMADACSLCNVIEFFCLKKITKIEKGGPSSPFKL